MAKKRNPGGTAVGVLAAILVVYLVGGLTAGAIVCENIFGHRGSSMEDLTSQPRFRIYKQRKAYATMQYRYGVNFVSGKNVLTGYYYETDLTPKGTVIAAHGFNSLSEGPESAYHDYFLRRGYNVYALDLTACGESEGKSTVSLLQSGEDVKNACKALQDAGKLVGETILAGYSWGAFGAARAVRLGVEADKLICFSAFDCAYEMMLNSAVSRSHGLAYATVPPFALGLYMGNGEGAFERMSEFLPQHAVKSFFAQGEKDEVVPLSISLAERMKGKATVYYSDATHVTPWFSKTAREYIANEIQPELDKVAGLPYEEGVICESVDKEKSSELDAGLFAALDAFLA